MPLVSPISAYRCSAQEAASAVAEEHRMLKRRQQQQWIAKWFCSGFIPRVSWVRFPFQTAPCFAQCRWKPVCILDHLWWETVRSVTDGSHRIRPGFTARKTGRNGNCRTSFPEVIIRKAHDSNLHSKMIYKNRLLSFCALGPVSVYETRCRKGVYSKSIWLRTNPPVLN